MAESPCPYREAARDSPDRPALISPEGAITYAEFDARVSRATEGLLYAGENRRGILPRPLGGQHQLVALLGPPSPGYLVALAALIRAGAIACPLNPRLPSAYLAATLDAMGCQNVLVGNAEAAFLPESIQVRGIESLARNQDAGSQGEAMIALDAPATAILTSGSTGAPKAALLSLGNHLHTARKANANMPLCPEDRWLLSLPLHHVSGLAVLFRCVLARAAVVIPGARSIAESIRRHAVTHLSLVPTQLHRMLDEPEGLEALDQCKGILVGGAAVPESLIARAHEQGLLLHKTYGLTEMGSQVATTAPGASIEALCGGAPVLEAGSVFVDADGSVVVHGKSLFLGYLAKGGLNRPFRGDGGFVTGDMGTLDERGCLRVTGRRDNLFICGGENIHPEEIERCILGIEGVVQVIVVPAPDPEYGSVPVAFVQFDDHCTGTPDVIASLRALLPRHKIPRKCLPWPEEAQLPGLKPKRGDFQNLAAGIGGTDLSV